MILYAKFFQFRKEGGKKKVQNKINWKVILNFQWTLGEKEIIGQ